MNTSYYRFGHDVFGPFLYGYTKWLREKIKTNGEEKIFFFSRDGYIMQKAYMLFDEVNPLGLEHSYVYFSRNSLRRGLLWNCCNYEETLTYLSNDRFTDISKIASLYGLEQNELKPLLGNLKLGWNEGILQKHLSKNDKVKKVFNRFEKTIQHRSREQYKNTICYLRQIGLHGKCAIVDIGWNGTMQFYLDSLLKMSGIDAELNAYYVGVSSRMSHKGKADGYVFNNLNQAQKKSLLCFLGGVEKLFQSSEGSTDKYIRENDAIKPILKPYEYEEDEQIKGYIKELQKGALDYVKYGISNNISFQKERDAYSKLIHFGKYPSYSDTQMFKFFYVNDGGRQYFIPQKPFYRYRPKEFALALSNSIWKTGFLKAAFRIPFPYYYIYKMISK